MLQSSNNANAFCSTFAVFAITHSQAKKQQKSYQANAQNQKNEYKEIEKIKHEPVTSPMVHAANNWKHGD